MLEIRQLGPDDIELMEDMLTMFGDAFNDQETYSAHRPSRDYIRELLSGTSFIAIAATDAEAVIGGLAAYELRKF